MFHVERPNSIRSVPGSRVKHLDRGDSGSNTRFERKRIRPVGLEPTTDGLENRCRESASVRASSPYGKPPLGTTAPAQRAAPDDPELAALVDAWPALPEAIRAGILAMVKAAGGR